MKGSILDQLNQIDRQFNKYEIEAEEAMEMALPLLKRFEDETAKLSAGKLRNDEKITKISLDWFGFGRAYKELRKRK